MDPKSICSLIRASSFSIPTMQQNKVSPDNLIVSTSEQSRKTKSGWMEKLAGAQRSDAMNFNDMERLGWNPHVILDRCLGAHFSMTSARMQPDQLEMHYLNQFRDRQHRSNHSLPSNVLGKCKGKDNGLSQLVHENRSCVLKMVQRCWCTRAPYRCLECTD